MAIIGKLLLTGVIMSESQARDQLWTHLAPPNIQISSNWNQYQVLKKTHSLWEETH